MYSEKDKGNAVDWAVISASSDSQFSDETITREETLSLW